MDTAIVTALISTIISILTSALVVSWQLGQYKNKVDNLQVDVKDVKSKLEKVQRVLTECVTKLEERTRSYASTLVQTKSPVTLTDNGQDLLQQSGADKFVLENEAELIKKIKAQNPHTAYDVQTAARKVVEELRNENKFAPFKDFVYKRGLDLEVIFIVMSIYLRDTALPTLGFKPEELDGGSKHQEG